MQLAGVSALALVASSAISQALACQATADTTFVPGGTPGSQVGTTDSVDVACDATSANALFDTGIAGGADAPAQITYNPYLGGGDDTVTILGGVISNADPDDLPPPVVNGYPDARLNGQDDDILTLGGADTVTISGGTIDGGLQTGDGDDAVAFDPPADVGDPAPVMNGTVDLGNGDDDLAFSAGTADALVGGGGGDVIDFAGGAVGQIFGDAGVTADGDDDITVSGGQVIGSVFAGGGADQVAVSDAADIGVSDNEFDSVGLEEGDDTFTMSGGTLAGGVSGGTGIDTFLLSGGTIGDFVAGGDGADIFDIGGTVDIVNQVTAEDGDDQVTMSGGTVGAFVDLGAGANTFTMSGGTVVQYVLGGAGVDTISVGGGSIGLQGILTQAGDDVVAVSGGTVDSIDAGTGNDAIAIGGTAAVTNQVQAKDGDDQVTMTGGSVGTVVDLGSGANTFAMNGGSVGQAVLGGVGVDTISISGTAQIGRLVGLDGADLVTVGGGTVDSVELGVGDDRFAMDGGTVRTVAGEDGADTLTVSGGTITGNVDGGAGADNATISGGTIAGNVTSETVSLFGGTIGGDVTGISGNTLTIRSGSLDLRDGVLFAGTNAVGAITDTDLAAGGESQNFTGFDSLSLANSTLRFTGNQVIQDLILTGGSTLFVNGNVTLAGTNTALGNLDATNSLIDLRNGVASDVLTLGGLALNGTTIRIDVDQTAVLADRIISSATTVAGVSTIDILLSGTPDFVGPVDIPILTGLAGVSPDSFLVNGVAGTPSSLFDFTLADNGAGDLVLRATPRTGLPLASVIGAINSRPADLVIDTVDDLTDQALVSALGLAGAAGGAPVSPAFGVFAAGSFAHTDHDGFDISSSLSSGAGPSFDSDDFSAAFSLDLDAAKQFQLDKQYGLNIGIFGGYASADVDVGEFVGFDGLGSARNQSGLFGTYGLFRKDYDYVLVSATSFLGNTEMANDLLQSTGDYDTVGYAVTGSVGHIFRLSDRVRFDLRGGLLGATFKGDDFTDSTGVDYGKSKVSFGAVKFEPGLYADFQAEGGKVFSPYTRLSLQQRFGYRNTSSVGGIDFDFEDSDFSASLAGGFNLKATQRVTFSSEVNGKLSSDSSQVAGKAGLKVSF